MVEGMGTSLSYTSRLSRRTEAKAEAGHHAIHGMPHRRAYAADQGWDLLMLPYVKGKGGAEGTQPSAADQPPPEVQPDQSDEAAPVVLAYVDPSDFVRLPRPDSSWSATL